MKRFITILIALSFLIIFSSFNTAQADTLAPNINIVLINQTPFPVEPGENLDIEIEIQNNGGGEARDTRLDIITREPFSLLTGEDATKSYNLIAPRNSVRTYYKLHVSDSAVTGDYEIDFRISGSDTLVYYTDKITIRVQGRPELILNDASISGVTEPGGFASLLVKVENIGSATAKKLKLEFNSTNEIIAVLGGGFVYLGDVGTGQIKTADMELSISDSAEHKTYITKLKATYTNEKNENLEKIFEIGIPVEGLIFLDVINIEPDFERNILKVDVINRGTSEAKSVEAQLMINGNITGVDYISQIKANKQTTFTFPLVYEGTGNLVLKYIGPGLETNEINEDVFLDYEKPSDNGTSYIAGVIIVIVAAYLVWRRVKRKK